MKYIVIYRLKCAPIFPSGRLAISIRASGFDRVRIFISRTDEVFPHLSQFTAVCRRTWLGIQKWFIG